MARPSTNNAFTLLESMLTLLIVTILGLVLKSTPTSSMTLFLYTMQMRCVSLQEQAYAQKESKSVTFYETYALFDDMLVEYPSSIVCSSGSFSYNAKGNISMAGTISCQSPSQKASLIFQLGSARVRYEIQ